MFSQHVSNPFNSINIDTLSCILEFLNDEGLVHFLLTCHGFTKQNPLELQDLLQKRLQAYAIADMVSAIDNVTNSEELFLISRNGETWKAAIEINTDRLSLTKCAQLADIFPLLFSKIKANSEETIREYLSTKTAFDLAIIW
jgi:hypothetical protein